MSKAKAAPKTPQTPRKVDAVDPRLDILWDRSERARLTTAIANSGEGTPEHAALLAELTALGAPK